MEPITLAAIALGGMLVLGKKKRSGGVGGTRITDWTATTREERLQWLHEIQNMSHWVSRKYGTMPHLSDYLVITSFRGARFNPAMVNDEASPNAARGLFDMRPNTTAQYIPAIADRPALLNNPYISFVVAIQHIIRAVSKVEQKRSGVPNWLAIRRWWTFPYLVHDFDESEAKSKEVHNKMIYAVDDCNKNWGTNINPDFWYAEVDLGRYPPTIEELMKDFGLVGAQA